MVYLRKVGGGPSIKTAPKWLLHLEQKQRLYVEVFVLCLALI